MGWESPVVLGELIGGILSGVLARLPAASQAALTGRTFFPSLLSGPFRSGLIVVFSVSCALSVLAGLASLLRGKRAA